MRDSANRMTSCATGPRCVNMAHRGASLRAPANTMPAFAAAIEDGADVIETDVHVTKDGVIVVAHDEVVDAVSDGSGRIDQMTYAELETLDFGYRFTQDGGETFPFRHRGIRIPTFLELLEAWPETRMNVDLKPKHASVSALIQTLYEGHAIERTTLASFHHQILRESRARCPSLRTSASPREVAWFLCGGVSFTPGRLPYVALQVPDKVQGRSLVTPKFVSRARSRQVEVHVWTVDDAKRMRELVELGVNGIVTNTPDTLRRVLLEWNRE